MIRLPGARELIMFQEKSAKCNEKRGELSRMEAASIEHTRAHCGVPRQAVQMARRRTCLPMDTNPKPKWRLESNFIATRDLIRMFASYGRLNRNRFDGRRNNSGGSEGNPP